MHSTVKCYFTLIVLCIKMFVCFFLESIIQFQRVSANHGTCKTTQVLKSSRTVQHCALVAKVQDSLLPQRLCPSCTRSLFIAPLFTQQTRCCCAVHYERILVFCSPHQQILHFLFLCRKPHHQNIFTSCGFLLLLF